MALDPISRLFGKFSDHRDHTLQWVQNTAPVLDDLSKSSEAGFLSLFTALIEVQNRSLQFAGSMDGHIEALRKALSEVNLSGESGIVARADAGLKQNLDCARFMVAELSILERQLNRLEAKGKEFQRLGISLGICRSTFAVDCGRKAEHITAFQGFLAELTLLAAEISTLGDTVESESRHARLLALDQVVETQNGLSSLERLTAEISLTANRSMLDLETTHSSLLHACNAIESAGKQIRKLAGESGFFLQLGDAVRQRLEHVVSALNAAATVLDRQQLGPAFRLQCAQLQRVAAEVSEARDSLESCLMAMGDQFSLMASPHGNPAKGQKSTHAAFDSLSKSLSSLSGLHSSAHQVAQTASERYGDSRAAAKKLADHVSGVRMLNQRMHLQALNAIVKSEAFGAESAALGSLSLHVHDLFIESNSLVDETIQILASIEQQDGQKSNQLAGQQTFEADQGIADFLKCLQQLDRLIATASSEAAQFEKTQLSHVKKTIGNLQFLGDLAQSADLHCIRLSEAGEQCQQKGWDGDWQLDMLTEFYTMPSEREVYASLSQSK